MQIDGIALDLIVHYLACFKAGLIDHALERGMFAYGAGSAPPAPT